MGAIAALVCAAMAWFYTRLAAPDAIWSSRLSDHPGYSPIDSVWIQEIWPTRLSDLSATASMAAALAVLAAFAILRRNGAGPIAASAAALGMALGGVFWSRTSAGHPATYAALLSLATLGALVWWRESRRTAALAAAAIALALAVVTQASLMVAAPVALFATASVTNLSRRGRAGVLAVMAASAVLGFMLTQSALAVSPTPADWLLPSGMPGFGRRVAEVGSVLVSDFGVLGLGFMAPGAAMLWATRRSTLAIVAGWSLLVAFSGLIWAPPDWRASVLPALAPLWIVVGAGLQWVLDYAGPRRAWAAVLVVALPVMSFASHYWMGARATTAREFTARYLVTLRRALPGDPVLLAEGGLIDRVASDALDAEGRRRWERVAQDPDRIDAYRREGRPVVALGGARANLAELGFRFEPLAAAGVLMTPLELVDTVPDGWIVAIAAGQKFWSGLPPTALGLDDIGATTTRFGTREFYAAIGVKGRRTGALEQAGDHADITVRAGDPAQGALRWPANIRAISDGSGGRIDYGGRTVASTKTGVAVAVISSTGGLAGAFGAEYEGGLWLRVSPAGFRPALVAGRETCTAVSTDRWVDVSPQAKLSSLAALLKPTDRLRVHLAGHRELNPRQHALPRAGSAVIHVQRYDKAQPDGLAAAADALSQDGIADAAEFLRAPEMITIDVAPGRTGPSLLALRLGGSADLAVARVIGTGRPAPVQVCSAMRNGPAVFAAPKDESVSEAFDLANAELLPYGWDRLEHFGERQRRWTRARESVLLVPVASPEDATVEIDLEPAGLAGAVFTLRVNDVTLAPKALAPGAHTYRFQVPAHAWRAGMNRMRFGTSALVRPSDVSNSRDDRQLGVAVSGLRFVRVTSADDLR